MPTKKNPITDPTGEKAAVRPFQKIKCPALRSHHVGTLTSPWTLATIYLIGRSHFISWRSLRDKAARQKIKERFEKPLETVQNVVENVIQAVQNTATTVQSIMPSQLRKLLTTSACISAIAQRAGWHLAPGNVATVLMALFRATAKNPSTTRGDGMGIRSEFVDSEFLLQS